MVPHALALDCQIPFADASITVRVPRKERLPHVLCVERQAVLLASKAVCLQAIGCVVRPALPREVSDLVLTTSYRVAVFGHTLSDAETAELAVHTKAANPGTRLVLVTGTQRRPRIVESLFDVFVPEARGPAALARSVRLLLAGVTDRRC